MTDPVDEREMNMDLPFLTDSREVPEGMLSTPHDRILKDDGYGRLVQLLDEAYELHNHSVTVSIVGRDPFETHRSATTTTSPPTARCVSNRTSS